MFANISMDVEKDCELFGADIAEFFNKTQRFMAARGMSDMLLGAEKHLATLRTYKGD